MKKSINTFIAIGLTVSLVSCGPSEESIKREMKLKMENKLALQDSIKTTKDVKLKYVQALSDAKGELEVAKDKLSRIKEWEFGRTSSEREDQIKQQTLVIDGIEKYIMDLQNGIPNIESKIDNFEMQLQILEAEINK
jgi:hypothetical protein